LGWVISAMVDADAREAEQLLVFTATYNERHNIGVLLKGIWDAAPHAQVLVVDDNSPDGTGTLLDEIARSESRLTVIHRPAKLGLGTAHHLAMLFALRRGFDTLITMDADLSHDPQDIPRLTAKLANADFVIGSRYAKGGSSGYSGYRHFVSAAANRAARLLLRLPLHEFTTSFRAFRVSRLSEDAQCGLFVLHGVRLPASSGRISSRRDPDHVPRSGRR
jgi:dolichol-phosphate mannosyltransferase